MRAFIHNALASCLIAIAASSAFAETGYITVQVQDAQRRPVRAIDIGVEGIGGSRLSGDDGKARLALAKNTAPNDWITLQILHSPAGKDFVMVSPWDYRVQVPSFAEKPENFIRVVVVERGDRAALENGSVVTALAAKINTVKIPKTANPQTPPPNPKQALVTVADNYGLTPTEVDAAIRSWGKKTTDHYEAGMAALYEDDYSRASTALTGALEQRRQKLSSDQPRGSADQKNVADAAFFLGTSLFQQGRYAQASDAFRACLVFRPNDPQVLTNLAVSLTYAANYQQAEQVFLQIIQFHEGNPGSSDLELATDLDEFGVLARKKGDYVRAEQFYRRVLAIQQKNLLPDNRDIASTLTNLGTLLDAEGKYQEAEPLLRRALAIDQKALAPTDPAIATDLSNLASLLQHKGDLDAAEAMYRRALAIDEKTLGPNHPAVATDLNNLAQLLEKKGDRAIAESLFRRALAINEERLGPDHPEVATNLNELALLLQHEGKLEESEKLYRRAIAIDEKALGPDHPITKGIRVNFASLPPRPSMEDQQ
jgi:tetratricopeptide (TPR) repeat protein